MSFKTEATPNFARELKQLIKKYPSLKKEMEELEAKLQENPKYVIPLGMDCYKIRLAIASNGSGKSGGARVITYVLIANETVYLVSIYEKSEQGDIKENDLKELMKQIP